VTQVALAYECYVPPDSRPRHLLAVADAGTNGIELFGYIFPQSFGQVSD
jgi:hypothetical protein